MMVSLFSSESEDDAHIAPCMTGVYSHTPSKYHCHCEPVLTLAWQSVPPWLPLWGSCHEVTERVKALSASGTSPKGRGKQPSSVTASPCRLHIIVQLPLAIVYSEFAAQSTTPEGKASVRIATPVTSVTGSQ